jgi:hypothetical protein
MLSELLYSILSVQIVYRVKVYCADSTYRERHSDSYDEFVTVQHIVCTDNVQCANEL